MDTISANIQAWNLRTPEHLGSRFYDVAGFLEGKSTLNVPELELLPDVEGKDLIHLQCHFGLDTLSWNRRGARVVGVDFSPAAVEAAKEITEKSGLEAEFYEKDVQDIKGMFSSRFDIGISSYGVLCWLENLDAWAEGINDCLKPGGRFVLIEYHPVLDILFDGKVSGHSSYFGNDKPLGEKSTGTYTNPDAPIEYFEYRWQHPISEVVGAFLRSGMELCSFKEYPYSPYRLFPSLDVFKNGCWMPSKDTGKVPYLYSLVFEKPAQLSREP